MPAPWPMATCPTSQIDPWVVCGSTLVSNLTKIPASGPSPEDRLTAASFVKQNSALMKAGHRLILDLVAVSYGLVTMGMRGLPRAPVFGATTTLADRVRE